MSKAKILKPFNSRPDGGIVHPGDPDIEVTDARHDELAAQGFVVPRAKAAPKPDNKMKPAPQTKAAS